MKLTARLLVAGLLAGSFAVAAPPASACDTPPKCASCRIDPEIGVPPKIIDCYN